MPNSSNNKDNLCVICHAYGEDKRTLKMRCMYAVEEVVPEMKQVGEFYEARICKACRGDLLAKMGEWRDERVELRKEQKDHDGNLLHENDPTRNIPVRILGAVVMMNEQEFKELQEAKSHA